MSQRFRSATFFLTAAWLLSIVFYATAFSQATIVSITSQPSHVGDTVIISGTGFDITDIQANTVAFVNILYLGPTEGYHYDSIMAEVIAATATEIFAIVPAGALNGFIYVTVGGEPATAINDVYFGVKPTISAFIPNSAYIGDTITITGTGFSTVWNSAQFTGNIAYDITGGLTSMKIVVPFGAKTGPVKVSNSVLYSENSMFNFNVLPEIDYLSETSGMVGHQVILEGKGFNPDEASDYHITFNGNPAVIQTIYSTSITTKVPDRATSGILQLIYKGNVVKGSGTYFTVIPTLPVISSYTPSSETIGKSVVIRGSGFDQAGPPLTVVFRGNVAAEIDSFTNTAIYTKVPLGAQSGRATVTAGGRSSDDDGPGFRVIETIFGMEPQKAHVGDTITIWGNGFTTVIPKYYFIGLSQTAVYPLAITDTTLTFVVPPGASYSFEPIIASSFYLALHITLPRLTIMPLITKIDPDTVIAGREMELKIYGTGMYRAQFFEGTVIFSNTITQRTTYNYTATSFITIVPPTVASGVIAVKLRVDTLLSQPVNLVVLPDTFRYIPPKPKYFGARDVTATSFRCFWSKGYRVLGYILDVSADNFNTFVPGYQSLVLTDTSNLISGLDPGTVYNFRVRPYSDTDTATHQNFESVVTIPSAPVAAPLDEIESGYIFRWSGVKGADGYLVEASDDFFETSISAYVQDTIAVLTLIGALPPLISFRVGAYNSSGISDYSNIITIMITGIEDEPRNVSLYPNPAKDYVVISGLPDAKNATVVDTNGKVTTIRLINMGDNKVGLDIRALPNGVYILQVVANQKAIKLKFLKE